ncbi:hypothetical protein [Anaerococcus cruorum]|uniref:hypothetical protein n=1 Tax=Anaerococcus sp. WGS1596 TaxID=3366806 RepID=UPI00372D59FE
MGKLFGQIFKEDFKSMVLWLFLPLASALIFMQLLSAFPGGPILSIAMGFSMTLLIIGPFLSLAIAAKNDNERFYGNRAGFYSALPLSTHAITGARIINYILLGIVIVLSGMINFIILNLASAPGLSLSEIFTSLSNLVEQIGGAKFAMALLSLFSFGVYIVSAIMLANTFGSSNVFGKKSKFGPIIVFLIIFFGLGMIGAKFQSTALADYLYQSFDVGSAEVEVAYSSTARLMLIPFFINILISLGFYGLTYYFHDKKLSVD